MSAHRPAPDDASDDSLRQRIAAHEALMAEHDKAVDALRQRVAAHESLLVEYWEQHAALEESAEDIAGLRQALQVAADELAAARRDADDIRGVTRTVAYRVAGLGNRMLTRVAPRGSARRRGLARVAGLAVRTVRVVRRRRRPAEVVVPLPPLALPISTETPLVSVVIPIHGNWELTEYCLRSIAVAMGDVPIEVLVVDDASPDDSRARLRAVPGVRLLELDENVGFTLAANAGIAAALGSHVVLLNNDTQVTAGWLEALLDAAAEPGVGLVGARLVFPDGRLQEAGGIVFDDGDGWNFGRGDDPERPQYTFRRDVDYCSGAALLLTPALLAVVPGFDERYAPAYYEDTDLAFEARRHGLRVVYEPRAVVIHFEGGTHGTDEAVGGKAQQVRNREIFRAKWAKELADQFPHDRATVDSVVLPAARRGRGTVVIVDHMVPLWREDSGSLRSRRMIDELIGLGYDVVLFPDNRGRPEPYTTELQEMGVLVWYGDGDFLHYLKAIASTIEFVMIARQPIAAAHLHNFRSALPGVPFVFDTVDLHFLREMRGAALEQGSTERAVVTRELELALMRATDATLVVSEAERVLLTGMVPEVEVFVVSNAHEHRAPVEPDPTGRSEITFVGSFQHPPNNDAMVWFLSEVLPLIEDAVGPVPVSIVGRQPAPEVVELASRSASVKILGWVEDLTPVHARTRVAIAPLRYGAGVKGKVGDAWSHGVPVVMTGVAAEGMFVETGTTAIVADDAEAFAAGVIRLLRDDEAWRAMSLAGRRHVEARFGTAALRTALERLAAHVSRRTAS